MKKKKFNLDDAKRNINICSDKNELFKVIRNYTLDYELSREMSDALIELAKEKNKTLKIK